MKFNSSKEIAKVLIDENSKYLPKINKHSTNLIQINDEQLEFNKGEIVQTKEKECLSKDKNHIVYEYLEKTIAGKDSDHCTKTNQDNYISMLNIKGVDNYHIFGVFDGHGI